MSENAINIYPSRQRVELNDKATKTLFNFTESDFEKLKKGGKFGILEKKKKDKKTGKVTKIISGYTLQKAAGFTFIAPLDEYDRSALAVCVTEKANGAEYITINALQRGLSGDNCTGDNGSHIFKNQFTRLKQALDKLMASQYDPEILESFKELRYEGAEYIQKAQILPAERLKKKIGGKVIEVIHFLDDSPLYKIAKAKGQILTYDADLLDVPNQQNTPLIIILKNYILRRVVECQQHSKQFKPILTLDDIFTKARITDNRKAKEHARAYIDEFFKYWQAKGLIKSYEFTKKGNKFHSIKFTF